MDEVLELASWFVSIGMAGEMYVAPLLAHTHSLRRIDYHAGGVATLLWRLLGFPSLSCRHPWACNIATRMFTFLTSPVRFF